MLAINWQEVLGPLLDSPGGVVQSELPALTAALQRHSPRAVRLHSATAVADLPFATEGIPWLERGRRLSDNSVRPGAYLNYAAGDYYIQDAGSMLALQLANVQPGQTVCDTCAAPGGKATGLLEQLGGTGVLLANEVIRSRLEVLALALARVGAPNFMITNLELESLSELCSAAFDCVLVDAPCTGQSMVARGKQSLMAFTSRQIEHSAARQQRILRSAAELVQPGGRLVYSTCTFAYAENEQIIEWLHTLYPTWTPMIVPELAPWHSPEHAGCYRLWPHRDHCDGAFAAALLCPANDAEFIPRSFLPTSSLRPQKFVKSTSSQRNFAPSKVSPQELPWLQFNAAANENAFWECGDTMHYFAKDFPIPWIARAYAGVPIAEDRGHHWQPAYAASVVNFAGFQPRSVVELNNQQAGEYLDGASLRFNQDELPSSMAGWTSVAYLGRPLGWGKISQGVLKNHLPKSLRKPFSSLVISP